MAYKDETHKGGVWTGGIIAGIIAGIVMAMFSMMHAGMTGMGFWTPLRLIAATLFGVDALVGTIGVLLMGLMIHMAVSAMFGVIFAVLIGRRSSGAAATGWGLLYGVLIWAMMSYLVVPATNTTMNVRLPLMSGAWFIEHLIFGVVLGITPAFVRRFATTAPGEMTTIRETRTA